VYPGFNIVCEADRLKFYLNRDGEYIALKAANQIIKLYLANCRSYRKKYGAIAGNKHPYRYGYIESAYSVRYLLRNKFLTK
jgi:hypothetical protein